MKKRKSLASTWSATFRRTISLSLPQPDSPETKSRNQIEVLATNDLYDFCIDFYLLFMLALITAWSLNIRNRESHRKTCQEWPIGALVVAET